jgi:23S rRNA G2069 N7-methylase RlmK/C1962 C5-methylase RlmI
VREGTLRFLVNLDDFLDVGLFPDHRETRAKVAAEARGKSFLNLFGYTGSFTCAAARGGAVRSTTVDTSSTYLEWARDNLALNGLAGPQHELTRLDAREFLRRARLSGKTFDLAFVDPPSFSTKGLEGADFDVQRDHRALLDETLAVVAEGGALWFSTNHQRFTPALDGLRATEKTRETVPVDYRNEHVHRCWRIER